MSIKNTDVYFSGNFWGHDKDDTPAFPLELKKEFETDDKLWYIPYLYISDSGITVDFCIRINTEEFKSQFIEKWDLINKNDEDFSPEELLKIEADNPLIISYSPEISVNGNKLKFDHSSRIAYNPVFPASIDETAKNLVLNYGLDLSFCWVFIRASFECEDIKTNNIKTLALKLVSRPIGVTAGRFKFSRIGATAEITNPVSGIKYTLTCINSEGKDVSFEKTGKNGETLNCLVMSYTIYPEISNEFFSVSDCERGQKNCAFSIIGTEENVHIANSAPMNIKRSLSDIEWSCVFYEKKHSDFEISFIL